MGLRVPKEVKEAHTVHQAPLTPEDNEASLGEFGARENRSQILIPESPEHNPLVEARMVAPGGSCESGESEERMMKGWDGNNK